MSRNEHAPNPHDVDEYLGLLERVLTASIYPESGWSVVQPAASPSPFREPARFARSLVHQLIDRAVRRYSLALVRRRPLDLAAREEGRDWPMFGYTMVGHKRLHQVRACIEDILRRGVEGDFIETGVWRGGTVIFMRAVLAAYRVTDRTVWVADSFEGLPPPASADDGIDLSEEDMLKVSLEMVRENFARFGLLDEQVRFLPGWFAATLPSAPINKLALLRLDGDLYSSTMDALTALYPRVSRGGYVIVDDYGSWPACKRAVIDYLTQHGLEPDIHEIDWTGVYWQVH